MAIRSRLGIERGVGVVVDGWLNSVMIRSPPVQPPSDNRLNWERKTRA